jgi:hypothetical protein
MIEMTLSDELTDEVARAESLRARSLVAAHLGKSAAPNLYVVSSLEEMLEVRTEVFDAARHLVKLSGSFSPAFRNYTEERDRTTAFQQDAS